MASATLALPCAAYEVDPLKCTRCGTTMRIIALIDEVDVIERILKHLRVWKPQPETRSPARPRHPDAATVFHPQRLKYTIEFSILILLII